MSNSTRNEPSAATGVAWVTGAAWRPRSFLTTETVAPGYAMPENVIVTPGWMPKGINVGAGPPPGNGAEGVEGVTETTGTGLNMICEVAPTFSPVLCVSKRPSVTVSAVASVIVVVPTPFTRFTKLPPVADPEVVTLTPPLYDG